MLWPGTQIAANRAMNRCKLFASAASSNSLLSFTHSHILFCDLSPYILSPHMRTLPILCFSTCIISWKPQTPNFCLGVMLIGKKIKTLLSYWYTTASSLSHSPSGLQTHNKPTPTFPQKQIRSIVDTITGLFRCLWWGGCPWGLVHKRSH